MECSKIQVTDEEKHSAALRITSAYLSALEGYINCYKEMRFINQKFSYEFIIYPHSINDSL